MKIFHLPDLGEGLAEAEIREWYVKVGDVVKVDQPLVSMETAKAVVDVPSPYAGKITHLHGKTNEIVKTGAPLVTYETEEVAADKGSVVGKLETSEKKWDDGDVIIGTTKTKSSTIKAMPAARALAQQWNVDLSLIQPTGPQGLITTDDVKQFIEKKPQTTQLDSHTEPLRGVRRVMAQTMAQSHREVVPVTIIEDADLTGLPSKTDITVRILKAIVAAAKEEPALNAWFDGKTLERKIFDEVHIGLAVDSSGGLFVPVIKNVGVLSDQALRQAIDDYKESINARTVSPTDLQGSTITLSNFGMIAGRYATPIIVPPAVAILGCGRTRDVVMPRDGEIIVGRIMPLSLTFDHRAVTGGEATRFLGTVIKSLQSK
ncbi:MAG: 2-oxo acid dehydrogenase subunit E2 [Gammaproteobacteria bacterium]|nr:2-oxo acid dehydrogenase subunit E2 [Gammaproteobacteria bacterium]MCW5582854.1 2-oxo acid dehydrogenase subunit E2 [Gammaproteobacteria bacterium]